MKKYILIALAAISFASCEEEISSNTPAFQATNGYTSWRATDKTATVTNGNLVVAGNDEAERLELKINGYQLGQEYTFGTTANVTAIYTKTVNDTVYTYKTSATRGSGFVKLSPVEQQIPGSISGTFLVELFPEGNMLPNTPKVHFNGGVFYQIPLTN